MTATALERLRTALEERGSRVTISGSQSVAQCPAHDDQKPSLSFTGAEGRVLVHCHAGCASTDVLAALGLTFSDLYDEPLPTHARGAIREHEYQSGDGRLVGVVQRFEPKTFRPLTRNGSGWQQKTSEALKTTPYRLPDLVVAVDRGDTVYVVEGEHDVDTLARYGIAATCNAGGAGKWSETHARYLSGANVVVVRDADAAGRRHGEQVVRTLLGVAASVQLVEPAEGCKDITEHLAAGKTMNELVPITTTANRDTVDAPPVRRLRVRSLREIKIVQTRYLWTDYLPVGELAFIVGKPGLAKSTIAVEVAAKITTGQLDGDFEGEPRHVHYSITEDSESTLKARFIAAGGDADYLHLVDIVHGEADDGTPIMVNVDLDTLRDEIETWQPALFVLDALNSSLTGQLNDNSNVRPQLERLKSLAHHTSTAILGVGHFRKSTAGIDPVDAIGGAGAYGQVVRHALACAADDKETNVMSLIKSNVRSLTDVPSRSYRTENVFVEADDGGKADVGRIRWLGEASTSVGDLLQRSSLEDSEERADAAEWLTEYLLGKGCEAPVGDILSDGYEAGFTKDVLKRAKSKAKARSRKADFGSGWVWRIVEPPDPKGAPKGAKGAP